ncbi:MAG TPA: RIP metalloprotease RseP [Planctomycetota bacterium]|nr:RIP metalloprotease RseP [Planctomycetota bacterium]
MLGDLGSILLAALGISFLIFIHELGHFLAARAFGVRVETFSIGFGPRLLGWRRGQTDYRLSLVPLGGYVKMAGEYGDLRDGTVLAADDLSAKPPWQRAIIFAGGVIVNVLFAFVAFPVAFALGVPFTAPVLGSLAPGGPAWQADLRPGDEVLAVDGHRVYQFQDIALEVALADPQHTLLRVRRDGREFDVVLRAERNQEQGRWEIGIGPAGDGTIAVEKGKAAATAGLRTGDELLAIDGVPLAAGDRPEVALEHLFLRGGDAQVSVRRGEQTLDVVLQPQREEVPGKRLLGITPLDTRVVALRGGALDARFPLQPGDVVRAVGGRPVTGAEDILQAVADAPPGPVTLAVERDGETVATLSPEHRALLATDVAFDNDMRGTAVRVIPEGVLAAAGVRDGDTLVALNGEKVHTYDDLMTRAKDETRFHVDYKSGRDGELHSVDVETRLPVRWDYGLFARMLETRQQESFAGALRAGVATSLNMLRTTWLTLKKLVTGDVAANNLGGIVSISVLTYQFADTGLTKLLYFLGLLSINLAFINVLPIPVLDGGQMLFLLLEKLKGGRLSERFMNAAQLAGLLAIVALVLYVTYNDITRLVG